MDERAILDELIRSRGDTYAGISALLGRNAAYIQQYIKRGSPSSLCARDQDILARYFGVSADFLRSWTPTYKVSAVGNAITHIKAAIACCHALGAQTAEVALNEALLLLEADTYVTRQPS